MAESDENFSSSTSEDDVDSMRSVEDEDESVTNQIAPYEGEPLASSDDNGEGGEEEDEGDEDGLTAATLERRFEKIEPVSSWYVIIPFRFVVLMVRQTTVIDDRLSELNLPALVKQPLLY